MKIGPLRAEFFWRRAGLVSIWPANPKLDALSFHIGVKPLCWVWGFEREPASIGDLWSFGLGPIFMICGGS